MSAIYPWCACLLYSHGLFVCSCAVKMYSYLQMEKKNLNTQKRIHIMSLWRRKVIFNNGGVGLWPLEHNNLTAINVSVRQRLLFRWWCSNIGATMGIYEGERTVPNDFLQIIWDVLESFVTTHWTSSRVLSGLLKCFQIFSGSDLVVRSLAWPPTFQDNPLSFGAQRFTLIHWVPAMGIVNFHYVLIVLVHSFTRGCILRSIFCFIISHGWVFCRACWWSLWPQTWRA